MRLASERDPRGSDHKTVDMPVAAGEDRRGPETMSVEDQLAALRQDMGQGKPNSKEEETEVPGAMKKPASSKKCVAAAKPKGRPRAKPKAGKGVGKTSQAKVEATSGREYASESRAYGARVSHGKHQWRTVTRRASAEGSCRGAAQDPAEIC